MTRAITATVLMSGGIDSATCAYHLLKQGISVEGLFIDYGQAASSHEARAAIAMARHLGIRLREVSVSGLGPFGAGELTGRNAFLIFAALFAARGRHGLVAMGLHSGTPYYDCSAAFVAAAASLVAEQTDGAVSFVAPFLSWTKREVHDYFLSIGLPIDHTYSCEAGTEPTCGSCASCRDRNALGC